MALRATPGSVPEFEHSFLHAMYVLKPVNYLSVLPNLGAFNPYSAVLRTHTWLPTQRSFIMDSKDHMECQVQTWVDLMQDKCPTH